MVVLISGNLTSWRSVSAKSPEQNTQINKCRSFPKNNQLMSNSTQDGYKIEFKSQEFYMKIADLRKWMIGIRVRVKASKRGKTNLEKWACCGWFEKPWRHSCRWRIRNPLHWWALRCLLSSLFSFSFSHSFPMASQIV